MILVLTILVLHYKKPKKLYISNKKNQLLYYPTKIHSKNHKFSIKSHTKQVKTKEL